MRRLIVYPLTWIYYSLLQLVIPDPIPDLPSVRGGEEESEKEPRSERDLHRGEKEETEKGTGGERASLNGKWSRSEAKSGSFRWYSRVRESTAVYGRSSILYEKALPLFSLLFSLRPSF